MMWKLWKMVEPVAVVMVTAALSCWCLVTLRWDDAGMMWAEAYEYVVGDEDE